MNVREMHREDVKAGLRKQYGSVSRFERERGLPHKSVNDVLRGGANARVVKAIEEALTKNLSSDDQPDFSGDSAKEAPTHRLSVEAR